MWTGTPHLAVRKRLAVTVTIGLLVTIALTFLTGFVAAALDLNRFAYHKYAAYAAIGLAFLHVSLHWRSLTAQMRRWLVSRPPAGPAAPAAAGGSSSRSASALAARLSRRALLAPGRALAAGAGVGHLATSRANPLTTLEPGDDLGQIYHQWSIPSYAGLVVKSVRVAPQPPLYKEFLNKPVVPLPAPPIPGGLPLEVAIARRRSVREYADRVVTLPELGRLLHYVTGITDRRDQPWRFGLSRRLGRCSRSRSARSCSKSPTCSLASTTTPCSSTPSNWCGRGTSVRTSSTRWCPKR